MLSHTAGFLLPLANNNHLGGPVRALHSFLRSFDVLGVELFFVLSGFLIGTILINTYVKDEFTFAAVRNFWKRRWLRTLPAYWLILTINIILYKVTKLQGLEAYKLLYYPFIQNLWLPHPPFFFGEAWSLSVEEWFYLTLPGAMLAAAAVARPVNKRKFLLRTFIGYLTVFLLARFINAFHPINGPEQDTGIRKVVLFRLDAVMYGVLVAWLNIFRHEVLRRLRVPLLLVALAGTAAIYYAFTNADITIANPANPTMKFISDAFLYLAIPLVFACYLPYAKDVMATRSRHFNGVVRYVSKISYSLYLVHYSLIFIPFFYFLHLTSTAQILLLYVAYWVIAFTVAALLYRYVEQPVLRWRDRHSKKEEALTPL